MNTNFIVLKISAAITAIIGIYAGFKVKNYVQAALKPIIKLSDLENHIGKEVFVQGRAKSQDSPKVF